MESPRGRSAGRADPALRIAWCAAMLLTACSGEPAATTSTAVADPTTTVTTSAVRAVASWARSTDPVFRGDGYQLINAVRFGGPGLVAVGVDSSGTDAEAAVWVSTDGELWTRLDGAVFGGPDGQGINDLAVGADGMVAVGSDESNGSTDAAVWFSTDGLSWEQVAVDALADPGPEEMLTVIPFGDGFVAAGFAIAGNEADAAVWLSPDGISWTRVHDPRFAEVGTQRIYSLTATADGLIAGGTNYHANPFGLYNLDARVWRSPDGILWEKIDAPDFGGPGWQYISAVAATPNGLIAAGGYILGQPGFHNDAAVWVSDDGVEWTRVTGLAFGGVRAQHISALVLDAEGIVAVGYDTAPDGNRVPAVWTSPDGLRWSRNAGSGLDEPGHRWMNGAAIGPLGLIAVGGDGTRPVGDPAVWWFVP
ncbi:MAG TPA: hypothetical protein VFY15_02020, partial [Acidimicrobiia bacterium]|nr:hypothetical protein [Acidimicrobiia bacterium]